MRGSRYTDLAIVGCGLVTLLVGHFVDEFAYQLIGIVMTLLGLAVVVNRRTIESENLDIALLVSLPLSAGLVGLWFASTGGPPLSLVFGWLLTAIGVIIAVKIWRQVQSDLPMAGAFLVAAALSVFVDQRPVALVLVVFAGLYLRNTIRDRTNPEQAEA